MGNEQFREGQQSVTAVMKASPLTIPSNLPLHEILLRFSTDGNRPLVVIGPDGVFVGVITPMDIVEVISSSMELKSKRMLIGFERFLKGTAQTAGDLISDERMHVHEQATVSEAISVMERTRSSTVIVVNEQNFVTGSVELSDIIAYVIRPKFR